MVQRRDRKKAMNQTDIDLGVFVRLFDKFSSPFRKMESGVEKSAANMNKRLSLSVKLGGAGLLAAGIAKAGKAAVSAALEPVRAVEKAKGELASLGIENLRLITDMGKKMESQWAGVTAAAFTSAAYDIKSGIASLTDEGVADMTRSAVTVAKATKGVPEEMTSLFATGYGIFKAQYAQMQDSDFGLLFGDMISASVQQFKTDGASMQSSIESAGKGATNMGLKMADQFAILGSLQAVMSGSEAGTALKAFAANSARADKAFSKMKITADHPVRIRILDEDNMMRAMPDILADLRARYGDTLDAAERFEIQQALGSEEAIKLIDQLYGQSDALRDNAAALEAAAASGGVFTAAMAKDLDNNWDSKLTLFDQKMNVIKMSIGEGMLPVMEALEPSITSITDAFVGFMDENPLAAQIIGFTVIALAGIATIAAPVLMGMAAMTIAAPGMGAAFAVMGTGIGVVGGAIKAVTMALLTNPIVLIIAAIALAAYLIYDNWDAIAAFFTDIWDQIKAAWEPVADWFGALWDSVSGAFSAVFTVIKALVFTFTPAGLIYKHWDSIAEWFGGLWDGVKAVFGALFDWAVSAFLNFTPAGLIYKHWDGIAGFFGGLWESVKSGAGILFDWAASAFLNFTPAGLIYSHWDAIADWFGGLWDGVASVFTGVWGTIESAAEGNFNPANMIIAKWASITAWFSGLWSNIAGVFSAKWAGITGMVSGWPAAMRQAGSDIVGGIIAGITAKWTALRNKVTGMGSAITGWFSGKLQIKSPSRVFMGLGGHISDGLALGIGAGEKGVLARIGRMASRIAQPIAAPRLNLDGMLARMTLGIAAPLALATGAQAAPILPAPVTIPAPRMIAADAVTIPTPKYANSAFVSVDEVANGKAPFDPSNVPPAPPPAPSPFLPSGFAGAGQAAPAPAVHFAPVYHLTVEAAKGATDQDVEKTRESLRELLEEMADDAKAELRRQLHD